MIDIYYVTENLTSKYVLEGLRVAKDIGDVTVTVQPSYMFSEEKSVVSAGGRNMQIIDIEYISAKEHAERLYSAIMELKKR